MTRQRPDAPGPAQPARRRFLRGAATLAAAGLLAGTARAEESAALPQPAPPADAPAGPRPVSKEFMLTFDDGPLPGKTERVLDALSHLTAADGRPVRAGFFMIGDAPDQFLREERYYAPYELWRNKGSMRRHPDLVRQVHAAGHLIGSHTMHHAWFRWPWLDSKAGVEAEITAWETVAHSILPDLSPRLLRTPYLVDNEAVRAGVRQMGYQLVKGYTAGDANPFASIDTVKWACRRHLAGWTRPAPALLIFHDILPIADAHLTDIVRHLQDAGYLLTHFDPDRLA